MIIDGHRQNLFGPFLTDDILVQSLLDLPRLRELPDVGTAGLFQFGFFRDDVVAEFDAFVADVNRRPCYQLADLFLTLSAKGAGQRIL